MTGEHDERQTEPPGAPFPARADRERALQHWLARNPIPSVLHPFLRGAVHGALDPELAAQLEAPVEDVAQWRACFALWASKTLEQAVSEILTSAQRRG